MGDCMGLNLSLSYEKAWLGLHTWVAWRWYRIWLISLPIIFLTAAFLLAMTFSSRWVFWSVKDCMVIHGYSVAQSSYIPVGIEPWHMMNSFICCSSRTSILGPKQNRWSKGCLFSPMQMIFHTESRIGKHSIQKIHLFMGTENENKNIAEILAGSSARENYKDILVSEGSCVVIVTLKHGMNTAFLRVGSTACGCWELFHAPVS